MNVVKYQVALHRRIQVKYNKIVLKLSIFIILFTRYGSNVNIDCTEMTSCRDSKQSTHADINISKYVLLPYYYCK